MVQSMTGYGKAEAIVGKGKFTVEIRSVNGKSAEINIKSSLIPKDKELWLRKLLAERLQRGSIDFLLFWEQTDSSSSKTINKGIALDYYRQILDLYSDAGVSPSEDVLSTILRLPDVIDVKKEDIITEDVWPELEKAIVKAIDNLEAYRKKEGEALQADLSARVNKILEIYLDIEKHEPERISAIRERILKAAEDLKIKMDQERFEQEMIFYLEKLDITEEKVRLRQHCSYFLDTLTGEPFPGKKLGFIIQEMGREINTTGSKANDADIQKDVVMMKDELEKIREQSMNIL